MARYDNHEHPPTQTPQETAIEDLVNKEDLKDYFDNLAAASTTEKVVLEQLMSTIAMMTINNEALVATNAKLAAEVTNLTRKLGRNTGGDTSGTAEDKHTPKTCPNCKKEGFHILDACLELGKNASKRPTNRKSRL